MSDPQHTRIGLPRWQQHTFYVSVIGVVTATTTFLAGVVALFNGHEALAGVVMGIGGLAATFIANVGSVLARDSGVAAANEVGERAGVVPPMVSEADQPAQGSSIAANTGAKP